MAILARYLEILVGGGHGGGRSDASQEVLFEALAAVLLVSILFQAWNRVHRESSPRDRALIWGFGIAAFRETSLFILLSLDIFGLFDYTKAHDFISPLDHILSLLSYMAISAAFINYFLKQPALTRRFISLTAALSVTSYAAALGIEKLSGVMIALPGEGPIPWYDLATHLPSAAILLWAMILLFNQRGWLRNVILAAFFLFFLHEAIFFISTEGNVVLAGLIHSGKHVIKLLAISLLGYVYLREMSQERLEARQALQKALEDSEDERRRTEAIMSAMGDAVSVHSPDLRIIYQNEASRKLMGDHVGEFCYRAQAGREDICPDCPVVFSYQDGGIHLLERTSEYHGAPRVLEVKASSIRDAAGRVVSGIKVIRDITGRRRAEHDLQEAKEELEKKVEELKNLDVIKDGLIRDVSHELKTPVAKQAMQLELLRGALGGECRGKAEAILKVMEASVKRQEQVIKNLLDLSRLESGDRKFTIKPVRIDETLRRTVEDYQPLAEPAAIDFSVATEPLTVRGDDEMLWHVFSNLINNAIKFRNKYEPCRIDISVRREGDEAVVKVTDHGIGLRSEDLPRVFHRFFQVSASVEGSGVGLSLCKFMVEAMGGAITLESAGLGQGATATVRFPAA